MDSWRYYLSLLILSRDVLARLRAQGVGWPMEAHSLYHFTVGYVFCSFVLVLISINTGNLLNTCCSLVMLNVYQPLLELELFSDINIQLIATLDQDHVPFPILSRSFPFCSH